MNIALRNLSQDKTRFAISSGGVALAIMLILVLNGFFAGMNRQVSAYLESNPIQLVVAQKQVRNFLGINSTVPLILIPKIEDVSGVKEVIPVLSSYIILDIGGRREPSLMIGFDPQKGGGPRSILQGTRNLGLDEVILDYVVANRHKLEIGDDIIIAGRSFKIVGISGGVSSWMTGAFFLRFETAAKLLASRNSASFLFVSGRGEAEISALRSRIADAVKDFTVSPKETVIDNDIALFAGVFGQPLRFMVIVAFLIGVLLVGAAIYAATIERAREYGVLKALGAKNSQLYSVVFIQAFIVAISGFLVGIVFVFLAVNVIRWFAPQFLILVEWRYVVEVFFIALTISGLASYAPVRVIAAIDPAIAFKRGA